MVSVLAVQIPVSHWDGYFVYEPGVPTVLIITNEALYFVKYVTPVLIVSNKWNILQVPGLGRNVGSSCSPDCIEIWIAFVYVKVIGCDIILPQLNPDGRS